MWTAKAREGVTDPERMPDAHALLTGAASISSRIVGLPMALWFTYNGPRVKPLVHGAGNDTMGRLFYIWDVENHPPHYLREWRHFRHMTQQELADAVGTSKTVI